MKYFLPTSIFFAFLVLITASCNKVNQYPGCYKLKALYINTGENAECPTVFEVKESPDAELSEGDKVTISTGGNYLPNLKIGDVIFLKAIEQTKISSNNQSQCPSAYSYHLTGSLCK